MDKTDDGGVADAFARRESPYADAIRRVERYHKDLEEFWKKADIRLAMAIDALLGLMSRMDKAEARLQALERPQPITAEGLAQRIAALEERLEDQGARQPNGGVAPELAAAIQDLANHPMTINDSYVPTMVMVPHHKLTRIFDAMRTADLLGRAA